MQPDTRKKSTKKTVKKVSMTDMMLIAHENGIFIITHPKSSDVMMLDIASFKAMSQIEVPQEKAKNTNEKISEESIA